MKWSSSPSSTTAPVGEQAQPAADSAGSGTWADIRPWLPVWAVLALIMTLSVITAVGMDRAELSPDGRENLNLSFHLWTEGSFSEDGETPSYLREPLPVAVTAAHLAWVTGIPESAPLSELTDNPGYLRQIVRVNLYYLIGLGFALWWLAWLLTKSHLAAATTIVGSWYFFGMIGHNWGNLLAEAPAALALVLASAGLVWLVQTKRLAAAVFAGVMLGALVLTKAAALYVGVVAIPLLGGAVILMDRVPRRRALGLFGLAALTFALTVTPWMTRNYVQLGDFAIAQRGGIVLYTRALKDGMSWEEYGGAFYAYAPPPVRYKVLEPLFGFKGEDLQPGGRYERLMRYPPGEVEVVMEGNVEEAVSFFGKAWATKIRLEEQMVAQGRPEDDADLILQERATDMIAANPAKHLALTVPFAWRGIWAFDRHGHASAALVNFLAVGALLALPVLAVWRRRSDWLAFSLVAVGLFWFHALLTHFIPRYSEPLTPVAVLALVVLLHALIMRWVRGRGVE